MSGGRPIPGKGSSHSDSYTGDDALKLIEDYLDKQQGLQSRFDGEEAPHRASSLSSSRDRHAPEFLSRKSELPGWTTGSSSGGSFGGTGAGSLDTSGGSNSLGAGGSGGAVGGGQRSGKSSRAEPVHGFALPSSGTGANASGTGANTAGSSSGKRAPRAPVKSSLLSTSPPVTSATASAADTTTSTASTASDAPGTSGAQEGRSRQRGQGRGGKGGRPVVDDGLSRKERKEAKRRAKEEKIAKAVAREKEDPPTSAPTKKGGKKGAPVASSSGSTSTATGAGSGGGSGLKVSVGAGSASTLASSSSHGAAYELSAEHNFFSNVREDNWGASISKHVKFSSREAVHPAVLRLALKFREGIITGSTCRCIAMLETFQQVVRDFESTASSSLGFGRELVSFLSPQIQCLDEARLKNVGMGNAIRYLKDQIGRISGNVSLEELKCETLDAIDTFLMDRIHAAQEYIIGKGQTSIRDKDVILVFAKSYLVTQLLLKKKESGCDFRVVVVDSRPKFEGKKTVALLDAAGIPCTYTQLSGLSHVMHEVTKVMLGASAMLRNGNLISRVGTASVALTAKQYRIPVIVCCESYKFSDKVQVESLGMNELSNPSEILDKSPADTGLVEALQSAPLLQVRNLVYDLTPVSFVDMLLTEFGLVPPTSVPAIMREFRKEVAH